MLLLLVVCLTFPPDNGLIHTFRLLFCLMPDIPEVHFCPRQGTCCIENSASYATFNKPSTRFAAPSGFPAMLSCYMLPMCSPSFRRMILLIL